MVSVSNTVISIVQNYCNCGVSPWLQRLHVRAGKPHSRHQCAQDTHGKSICLKRQTHAAQRDFLYNTQVPNHMAISSERRASAGTAAIEPGRGGAGQQECGLLVQTEHENLHC